MTTATKETANLRKPGLQVVQVVPKTTLETQPYDDSIKGLMDVLKEWNIVREAMPRSEWDQRLTAALKCTSPIFSM